MTVGDDGVLRDEEGRPVIRDKRRIDPTTGEKRTESGPADQPGAESIVDYSKPIDVSGLSDAAFAASESADADQADVDGVPPVLLLELEQQVAERTADLQRLQAEYANYRKRVERDREAIGVAAVGGTVVALLPVYDDIERARQHGDLTGAFKSVADSFDAALAKLGVVPFGVVGDVFDPTIHEAVMHSESTEVTEPTCTTIMRQGFMIGEKLLRPALVGVSEPASHGAE